ncbi:epimerase [Virgisporangium aurantiacum]|uniref:Epimerase n=2 Tax=Virgisporangium aurantiacum TaxID=175570 RepID=A0A8J3ZB88_9ACTN|nr:epimerase [Virgisporangium aurantiacum]
MVGSAVVRHLLAAGRDVTTLTLPGVTPHAGVRAVFGDARDEAAVTDALDGVDAVAHLAAIPNPLSDPAPVVFANNTQATFTVLWTAAALGVRRFAIASSVSAAGRSFNPHRPLPAAYPVDETMPADLGDPYGLSKQVDELTLGTVCRRFGAAGVALRLPLMIAPSNLELMRRADLASEVGNGWAWLDVRDGAEAFRLALTVPLTGAHVVHLAAAEIFPDGETEELLDRHAPGVPRRRSFAAREVPVDTGRARALLGFEPRFRVPSP